MYRRISSPARNPHQVTNEEKRRSQSLTGAVETAKVTLPPSWKGFVTIGETTPAPQVQNFKMGLYALNEQSQFRGIIFRNLNPIEEIRPFGIYSANKDALRSLQSLDHRLKKELSSHPSDPRMTNEGLCRPASHQHQVGNSSVIATNSEPLGRYNAQSYHSMKTLPEDANVVALSPEAKHDSVSVTSSTYLDLSDLESSLNQSKQSRLSFYANRHRTSSIFSDKYDNYSHNYDNYSLASSSGSLAFDSQSVNRVPGLLKSPRYPDDQLNEISKLVKQISDKEGCVRNYKFQSNFQKICDVVNVILSEIPSSVLPFNIKETTLNGNYETVGINNYEIYVIPEINKQYFEVSFPSKSPSQANVFLIKNNPSLEIFCVEDATTNRRKLSPCKLMIIFAHVFSTSAKDSAVDGTLYPYGAQVFFDEISEKGIDLTINFRSTDTQCKVSLILALDVDKFPETSALFHRKDWPMASVKQQVSKTGVHLIARLSDSDIHTWKVKFLKARQTLLQGTDDTGNKLRLLLVMQCLRETVLSQPDIILPSHLATIIFWASVKFRAPTDWTNEKLGKRFLDFIVALRRCLWRRECADFFIPNLNLFGRISKDDSQALLMKLDEIIKEPLAFLKSRLQHKNMHM